jgi:hypothetical protein
VWSMNVSLGSVLAGSSWAAAVGLIMISWAVDVVYISFLGIVFAALAGTLTLSREHHRTRRHVYLVARVTDPLPTERRDDHPVANLSRVKREP